MLQCDSPLCVAAASKQASLRQQSLGRSKSFIQKPASPNGSSISTSAVSSSSSNSSSLSNGANAATLEAQKRECKARLHVVNAEVVAAKQPARQRELLEERTHLLATIDLCNAALAQLRQSAEHGDAQPTPRDAPATPRGQVVPAGTVCVSCASTKIGGRVKAEDGSSLWFCRACLMQVAKCMRCGKIGKNHTSATVGGVDGVVCPECAVALKPRAQRHTISVTTTAAAAAEDEPPPPLTSSKSVSSPSPAVMAALGVSPVRRSAEQPSSAAPQRSPSRRATDAVPSLSSSGVVQSSPARRVDAPSRLSQSSNDGESPRGSRQQTPPPAAPMSHNSSPAPRRLAISEPPEESPALPRAKSSSAVSSMKLDTHTAASIWGRRGAPWESFKAPAPRRQLADLLPSTAARPAVSGVECCFVCGSEPVGLRVDVERKGGRMHAIPLCTSCHISLNSRLARGE